MAIDPNILLQGRVPDIGNALIAYRQGDQMRQQRQEAPLRNRLLTAQVAGAEQQQQRGAMQQLTDEQKSLMLGAAEIKPLIDAGDANGALAALSQRKDSLKRLGLNTQHTDEAIQMLQSGNVAGLKGSIDALYTAGLRSGVLSEPDSALSDYRNRSLDLQTLRIIQDQQNNAENRAFRQQQLEAQLANQQGLNAIRQQQADTAAAAQKASQESAAQKAEVKATGLDQELISLEGVMADINRAEELLKTNKNITGPLIGMTPNVSEASQELESLSQALGIGALQQFKGATSEKELAAALRQGLSMKSDAAPNLKRLAAQKAVVQRNIDRIKKLRGNTQPPQAQGGQSLGTHPQYGDITEDDIQATMKANNMTREQVLQRLGGQ